MMHLSRLLFCFGMRERLLEIAVKMVQENGQGSRHQILGLDGPGAIAVRYVEDTVKLHPLPVLPIHSLARSVTQLDGRPTPADGITDLETRACESTNLTAGAEVAISYQATCFAEVSIKLRWQGLTS